MFKKTSATVNALTAIAAVFLSILLVVALPLVTLYGVAVNSVSADAISTMTRATVDTMVESADFEQMILENEAVQANIQKWGISTDVVGKLMQSDAADEVIGMLSTDMSNLLTNPDAPVSTTPDALVAVIKEHADELAQIAVEATGKADKKEQLKSEIIAAVEKDADSFTVVLPNMEELRASMTEELPVDTITSWLKTTYLWIGYGVCLLLAALIYACRLHRFQGFLWVGIDGLLSAGIIGILSGSIHQVAALAVAGAPESSAGILNSIIKHVVRTLNTPMWITLGISVLFIVGYILLYTLVVKKKDAAGAAPVAAVPARATDSVATVEE